VEHVLNSISSVRSRVVNANPHFYLRCFAPSREKSYSCGSCVIENPDEQGEQVELVDRLDERNCALRHLWLRE